MGMLCAVTFTRYGRLYYADPGAHAPKIGEHILVSADNGPEVGLCVWAPQWVDEDTSGFPKVLGLAEEKDMGRDEKSRRRKAEVKVAARRLIREHKLPMRVVGADAALDDNRVTVYFTAPQRVDFRSL